MTARTVDLLLDERARLVDERARIVAQKTAIEGHLWASEFLLHRVRKLLPHLIADNVYNGVARDTLMDEIDELLSEERQHPGPTLEVDGDGENPAASSVTLAGADDA